MAIRVCNSDRKLESVRSTPLYPISIVILCVIHSVRTSGQAIIINSTIPPFYSFDTSSCMLTPINSPVNLPDPSDGYVSCGLYDDTLYFTTGQGRLCRFVLGDTSSLTELRSNVGIPSSLTVDANGLIYWMNISELYKYDPHSDQLFDLGTVNYPSAGDLLFYGNNLILASTGSLILVNLANPG